MSDQPMLFEPEELVPWMREWKNMPEFRLDDLAPKHQLIVNFACAADVEDFGRALGQAVKATQQGRQLQSIWFPDQEIGRMVNKRYIDREQR